MKREAVSPGVGLSVLLDVRGFLVMTAGVPPVTRNRFRASSAVATSCKTDCACASKVSRSIDVSGVEESATKPYIRVVLINSVEGARWTSKSDVVITLSFGMLGLPVTGASSGRPGVSPLS